MFFEELVKSEKCNQFFRHIIPLIAERFFDEYRHLVGTLCRLEHFRFYSEQFLIKYSNLENIILERRESLRLDIVDINEIHVVDFLAENPNLSLDFIIKNLDILPENLLLHNSSISIKFIEKYFQYAKYKFWKNEYPFEIPDEEYYHHFKFREIPSYFKITGNVILPEHIIEQNHDKIDFENLTKLSEFVSEEFLERHSELLNLKHIWKSPNLSEEFIERHLEKVNWSFIPSERYFSPRFYIKYHTKIGYNHSIPIYFLKKNPSYISNRIYSNPHLVIKYLDFIINHFTLNTCPSYKTTNTFTRNFYLENTIYRLGKLSIDF